MPETQTVPRPTAVDAKPSSSPELTDEAKSKPKPVESQGRGWGRKLLDKVRSSRDTTSAIEAVAQGETAPKPTLSPAEAMALVTPKMTERPTDPAKIEAGRQKVREFYAGEPGVNYSSPLPVVMEGQQIFRFDTSSGKERDKRVYEVAGINPRTESSLGSAVLTLSDPDNPSNAGWSRQLVVPLPSLDRDTHSDKPSRYKAVQPEGQFSLPKPPAAATESPTPASVSTADQGPTAQTKPVVAEAVPPATVEPSSETTATRPVDELPQPLTAEEPDPVAKAASDSLQDLQIDSAAADALIAADPANSFTVEDVVAGETDPQVAKQNVDDEVARLEEKAKTQPLSEAEEQKHGFLKLLGLTLLAIVVTPIMASGAVGKIGMGTNN